MRVRTTQVSAAAIVAAGLSTFALGLASPAGASCASIGAGLTLGNAKQCSAPLGNTALALGPTAQSHVLGGVGNSALSWGTYAAAITGTGDPATDALNIGNTSVAGGDFTNALSAGLVNTAADIGPNSAPSKQNLVPGSATAAGSLNRVINIGGDNTGVALNTPSLEAPFNIGGNSVTNLGPGNTGLILGAPLSKSNSSLSNVVNIGDGNFGTADGNGSTGIAAGNGNNTRVNGNMSLVAAVGQWNNAVVEGNNSLAAAFGNQSRAKVTGNNSLAALVGNQSRAKVTGNKSLAATFGNRSRAVAKGDNQAAAAVGDDQEAHNGVNNG